MPTVGEVLQLAKGSGPQAAEAIDVIAAHRRTVTQSLLTSIDTEPVLAQRLAEVTALAAAAFPWDPIAEDYELARLILERWAQSAVPETNVLMAAMALAPAHHFTGHPRLALVPSWLRLHYALFLVGSPSIFLRAGEADRYAAHCTQALTLFCEAIFEDRLIESRELARISYQANPIMTYFSEASLRSYFKSKSKILEWYLLDNHARLIHLFPMTTRRSKKVGILHRSFSIDTEAYFLLSRIEGRDRSDLDITIYIINDAPTALSAEITRWADRVVTLPTETASAVAKIRNDDLDLCLISNNISGGLTLETEIAAHRLARVQVTNGSSPITPGLSSLDIFLSSEMNDPSPTAEEEYEENLVRLSGSACYFSYMHDQDGQHVTLSRLDMGISENTVMFLSAANYFKITPELLSSWAEILSATPGSELVLMPFNPTWGIDYPVTLFLRRLSRELVRFGVAPSRVKSVTNKNRAELQAVMSLADIYLDSFPYSGSVSLIDPLMAGLPVVARDGDKYRTALAASALRLEGLEDSVCADGHAYVDRAVRLAREPEFRAAEAGRVSAAATPLLNCLRTEPFVQKFAAFCGSAIAASVKYTEILRSSSAKSLTEMVANHVKLVLDDPRPALRRLIGTSIVAQLLVPYVETLMADGEAANRIIDLSVREGQLSTPFLQAGFRVEMFEPDPGCANHIADLVETFPGLATHHWANVVEVANRPSNDSDRTTGLPGLGVAALAAQAGGPRAALPITLDRYVTEWATGVDVIAVGADLGLLQDVNLISVAPKIVVAEFGVQSSRQSHLNVRAALAGMDAKGYGAVTFEYRKRGSLGGATGTIVELADIALDEPRLADGDDAFGHIVFYRHADTTFLACLIQLLEFHGPAQLRRAFEGLARPGTN